MAKANITKTVATGPYATAGVAVTMTAPDSVDGAQFVIQGNEVLLIQNTGGSSYTYTIQSSADRFKRTGDIATQSIAAGVTHAFGPMQIEGWVQSDGKVYVAASNVAVKFGIYQLPG